MARLEETKSERCGLGGSGDLELKEAARLRSTMAMSDKETVGRSVGFLGTSAEEGEEIGRFLVE